ncbi:hypothetical protein C8A00DRAFT_11832 [Chaetomidium leptoderma]|uniref:Uncharacterized protein n=1 Tax=Chaetomidium leptoderma TaxID=669021 RepID=A0AAN6VT47_9PEZI|nr:hypothetical protein C8A00DRAFT_11832 [Chaetomidium leptoderma]
MLSDTFSSWFVSFASCCGSRESVREKPRSSIERNIVVLRDQPVVIPRPSAEPSWSSERTYEKTLEQEREKARLWRPASRDSSARKNWFSRSSSSVRRLQISGPTDFRHVHSESFQFPPQQSRPRPRSFRPIELSIYQPQNRLSAILPHVDCNITPPPRAHTSSSRWEGSSDMTVINERGHERTMSFHVPRKHGRQGSGRSDAGVSPPRIPPKSRARALTAPSTERIVERIASAILEKERLQTEINTVIVRQSIYMGRPSIGYDMRGMSTSAGGSTRSLLTSTDLEPMPSIPALPAAAPSFAERLSVDDRPRTAPSHMNSMTVQERTLELAAAAQSQPQTPYNGSPHDSSSASENDDRLGRPLAPPLPLVLRPPLRKKKSFSRVSNWLFNPDEIPPQGQGQIQGESADSSPTMVLTTSPRPVKESDGFYQCVAPPEGLPRTSMETSSSVYTWVTGDDDDEDEDNDVSSEEEGGAKTVPTTMAWSPEQTPKQGSSRHTTPVLGGGVAAKGGEFEKEMGGGGGVGAGLGVVGADLDGHRPLSVGVAF